ncbi:MarR family winged helix-turn-helix transcriptional regulator [Pacificibacter sp. AS14]|uniref:MarR family winged helix-turn-helix transcriptional regulator n=1 Tax=Pacificibacter sp. AS14 TaxID=3135785 RepID=UPI00317EFB8D
MTKPEKVDYKQFFGDSDPRIGYNRVWFFLMRAHRKLQPQIAKVLRDQGISDPIWYEVLLHVEEAGEQGHLMVELETKLFVTQYALSRHITRIEKAGYIRRAYLSDGRRRQVLFVTDKGRGLHDRIWPAYMEAMQTELSPLMSCDEAYELAYMMLRMLPRDGPEE